MRITTPYVVVIQSALYDGYSRRVVAPLVKETLVGKIANPRFNPTFTIESIPVVPHPLDTVSTPLDKLGEPIDSLADEADRIIAAMGELLASAWG